MILKKIMREIPVVRVMPINDTPPIIESLNAIIERKREPIANKQSKVNTTSTKVLILNCSLKLKEKDSNTWNLAKLLEKELQRYSPIEVEILQVSNMNLQPGLVRDIPGVNDDGKILYDKIEASDIVIIGTPIWWGVPSSLVQRIIERLDGFDEMFVHEGVNKIYGKVFGMLVTGSDDGVQSCLQRLFGVVGYFGFTIPPGSYSYAFGKDWNQMKSNKAMMNMVQQMALNITTMSQMLKTADKKLEIVGKRIHTYGADR